MQQKALFHKFSSALSWNAFLYIAHRIFSTILVIALYKAVPAHIFSTWATLSSIIYLALLWLDFGFRKSIARYAPIFAAHRSFALFTRTVLTFQSLVLLIALPLFTYALPFLLSWILHNTVSINTSLRIVASGLFVTEGLTEMLRLLYHAHFLNKPFNLLATSSRLFESIASIILISHIFISLAPSSLIIALLFIKLISGLITITVALIMLPKLYRTATADNTPHSSTSLRPLWYGFARHSAVMWASNAIKSLSERNFILPILTRLLGPDQANLFKLAQDSALLFERSIIKTIGTADTALLAHAEGKKETSEDAFIKLTRQVAGLCIPLFGFLIFLLLLSRSLASNQQLFQIFLLLTATYLIEVLVSPYERLLEVKQRYLLLGLAYVPYIAGIFFLFYNATSLGLINFIVLLQGMRLISSFLMVFFVRQRYKLGLPLLFIGGWFVVAVTCALIGWVITRYLLSQSLVVILKNTLGIFR